MLLLRVIFWQKLLKFFRFQKYNKNPYCLPAQLIKKFAKKFLTSFMDVPKVIEGPFSVVHPVVSAFPRTLQRLALINQPTTTIVVTTVPR